MFFYLIASLIRWFGWLLRWYIKRIVCMHFCKFREAGSDLKYTHVHLYGKGSDGITGIGHDDHTGPDDQHHNTVSKGNNCKFHKAQPDKNGKITGYFHPTAKFWATAYFHPCDKNGKCPPGYTKIRCKCKNKEGETEEVCVCYTLDHDAFQRWYDEQEWNNRTGSYKYPSVNVRGPVPATLKCGTSVTLLMYEIKHMHPPANCTGYGGPGDGNNPLIEEARKALKAAADKISCEVSCQKSVTEVFKGWKCQSVKSSTGQYWRAEAVVQWKVECKK